MKEKWVLSAKLGDVIHVDGFPWKVEAIEPHVIKLVDEETGEIWQVELNKLLAMDIDLQEAVDPACWAFPLGS